MRCLWSTDIHLNFVNAAARRDFAETLVAERPDAVWLTGDIGEADTVGAFLLELEHRLGCPIYFVLGNHDFYRASIAKVRHGIAELTRRYDRLRWLNTAGVVRLTDRTALVGHDSWADGRLGSFASSTVELTDFWLIDELRTPDKAERLARMQRLAEEAAAHFARVLPEAFGVAEHVFVLTHVPPFREAAWHEGAPSEDDWLPFFAAQCVGDVLTEIAAAHGDRRVTVLCGHTHGNGMHAPLPNLTVFTGGAKYGSPAAQRVFDVE